jgi:hypothetical protein
MASSLEYSSVVGLEMFYKKSENGKLSLCLTKHHDMKTTSCLIKHHIVKTY